MRGYGITDVGRKRLVNQDSFSALQLRNDCFIAVICDGMGGVAGGGIASSIAKDVFLTELQEMLDSYFSSEVRDREPAEAFPRLLCEAVSKSNSFTYGLSVRDPGLKGMGTTLVAVLVYKDRFYVCNVGDSRLYALKDRKVTQVTKDHSYVQELLDSGRINARQARESLRKNIITRAVGVDEKIAVDTFVVPVSEADYILLCSDGLSNHLESSDLKKIILSDVLGLEKKVKTLVDLANERGGSDNITAYLIDLSDKDKRGKG